MPAVTIQAIHNKKNAKKARRQIERENQIESLGGIRINICLCKPLDHKESMERSKYLRKLKGLPKKKYPCKRVEELDKQAYKRKMIQGARARTRKTNLPPVNLKAEDIRIPEFCPILGIKLEVGGPSRETSPSLDRVNPLKGYTKDNICVISNRANRIKSNATLEELLQIVEYIKRFGGKSD